MDPTTMSGEVIPEATSSYKGIQIRMTSGRREVNASVYRRDGQSLQTKKKRIVGIQGRERNKRTK